MEQRPQLLGIPEQGGISVAIPGFSPEEVAKTESFFSNFLDPQAGHSAWPRQSVERTSSSESLLQSTQLNS